jgi:ribonuclease HI
LEFEATNNVVEYEGLIMGLEVARKMHITELVSFGDSELVVQQIKGGYQIRHPEMRAYKNQVWDLIDNFNKDFNIIVVSREVNQQVDSLEVVSNTFKTHFIPRMNYDIDMR